MYNDEEKRTLEGVGAMSYKAIQMARGLVKPGVRLVDVAEKVEKFVMDNGFGLAFPLNLSVNSEAAHYTPSVEDERAFSENDIVKIDFGAEKDGLLGDCAVCIDLSGHYSSLVEGAEAALAVAISRVRPGVTTGEIGREIAKAIEDKGGRPIRNLGGHGVGKHDLHSEPFIPNYDDDSKNVLEEGMVIAIEPFATDGKGLVTDGDSCEIYQYVGPAQIRQPAARQVLEEVTAKYGSEPFAVRWLARSAQSKFSLYAAIRELERAGAIEPHPTLVEIGRGHVAQAEAMVIVEKDGCKVLTK